MFWTVNLLWLNDENHINIQHPTAYLFRVKMSIIETLSDIIQSLQIRSVLSIV